MSTKRSACGQQGDQDIPKTEGDGKSPAVWIGKNAQVKMKKVKTKSGE